MIQANENEFDNNNESSSSPEEKDKNETKSKISAEENKVDSVATDESLNDQPNEEVGAEVNSEDEPTKEPVRIEFPYSELLRDKVPKVFEVAEKVATDWKHEGDFTDLGIKHPVAGIVAAEALNRAKKVEKKLEEKGVMTAAKIGFEIAKSQVENIKGKIKKS